MSTVSTNCHLRARASRARASRARASRAKASRARAITTVAAGSPWDPSRSAWGDSTQTTRRSRAGVRRCGRPPRCGRRTPRSGYAAPPPPLEGVCQLYPMD
eukprot:327635-Pyramimonas_sp.AAC.1